MIVKYIDHESFTIGIFEIIFVFEIFENPIHHFIHKEIRAPVLAYL